MKINKSSEQLKTNSKYSNAILGTLLTFTFIQNALGYSDKMLSKLISHVTSYSKSENKIHITYQDGHTDVLNMSLEQYRQNEEAKMTDFLKNPTKSGFNLLREEDKIRIAAEYLSTRESSATKSVSANQFAKSYFEGLDPKDKSELGIGAIQNLSHHCGYEKMDKDCETRQSERMGDIFRKINEWNKSDLHRAACAVSQYLTDWNPTEVGHEVGLSEGYRVNSTKILLRLMDTSPEFQQSKNTDCEGFMEKYQIYDKLMSAKHYLPSIEARMKAKPTPTKTDKAVAIAPALIKGCSDNEAIKKLLEGTKEIYSMESKVKYISIYDDKGCAGSVTLQRKSQGNYTYEQRNNLYMTTGEPINFANDSDLIAKVYGIDTLKSPSVQSLLTKKPPLVVPATPPK